MEITQEEYERLANKKRRPTGLLKVLACLSLFALAATFVLVNKDAIKGATVPILILPTSQVAPQPTQARRVVVPTSAPNQDIANYNATQTALWNAAQQVAPIPNQDNTGDTAPVQYVSKPAVDRVPPPPVGEASVNDGNSGQFGSKQTAPINIQATHQCLHGQVWTDTGCHRPTPTN